MKKFDSQIELTKALNRASIDYYNGCITDFSDIEFDKLLKQLQQMEKESGIVYDGSPTKRVGSDIQKGFKKGEHPKPMFTIENTYDDKGLSDWVCDMVIKHGVKKFNISIKYDGVSCELWYRGGTLIKALTRGDKIIGDDITENVKTIKNVPLELFGAYYANEMVYVRGEILMPKSRLEKINEQRINEGLTIFSNTRNACTGSIKQLDPKVTASRGLIFKAWDVFTSNDKFETMSEKTDYLEDIGFYYEDGTKPFTVDTDEMVNGNVVYMTSKFKNIIDGLKLDYDYDGIVIKVDDVLVQDEIGTKDTRAIEWGIARKWNEEKEVRTKLLGVDWQVGRTGVLTPVGRLDPVICDGVEISNVTLHNWDFIKSKDIKIFSELRITRSGGVIPYVIDSTNNDSCLEIIYPEFCPICGSKTVNETEVLITCPNKNCSSKEIGRIIHFCSRECMDIRGIGENVAKDLYNFEIIYRLSDLFGLVYNKYDAILLAENLGEGYGVKSCEKLLESIKKSMGQDLSVFLSSLSIPGVGKTMGRVLSKKFNNLDNFMNCTIDDLLSIDGIGDIMAYDIYDWTKTPYNIEEINYFKYYGYNPCNEIEIEENTVKSNVLEGLKVCFTGKSNRFKGDEVESFLEQNGAKCASVSKSLDYLIIGDKPGGSKVKKATELGITIITEDEFYTKYNI